ncbi:MAG: cytochrome P450 [bacterium]|nr:cytochrome P450 [Deltaproteobacteria bacterium]MCP4904496.1 cytochrome P450 [bacterium]
MNSPDDFDLLDPETLDDPYPFYAALREQAPVHQVQGTDVYLVSTRPLIEEALERQDDFSANLTGTLMTGSSGEPVLFDLSRFGSAVDAIANADEPAHAIHRKLVLPHVTPKGIAALEPTLRAWATEMIIPLIEVGNGDWVDRVANPLPTRAMALVVGLPLEDTDQLLEWAMTGTEILAGSTTSERMAFVGARTGEMVAYLEKHLNRALDAPADHPAPGVIGELARGVKEGLISTSDGVSILVVLAGAGGESTSSLTGNAVRILAEQPELQSELRAKPTLIPTFVEEAIRLESSFRGHYRAVKRDTSLGETKLAEGSRVLLLWAAVNRDPAMFPNPDAVDLSRPNLREHMAFGRGLHFCVGARLARLEARVILEELLARTRAFSLDARDVPRYVRSLFVRRHAQLPLVLEA